MYMSKRVKSSHFQCQISLARAESSRIAEPLGTVPLSVHSDRSVLGLSLERTQFLSYFLSLGWLTPQGKWQGPAVPLGCGIGANMTQADTDTP